MCKDTKKFSNSYNIQQLKVDFPDDGACLFHIFKIRYGNLTECPKCNQDSTFNRVSTRKCFQCSKCYFQIYPCSGTIFEKTRVPLTEWFYVIYLFTVSKNGISAYEVQRQIGGAYKRCLRMLRQIRILLSKDNPNFFDGTVELDETFVGGKNINRHRDKKVANSQGRSFKDKTPVFGIFERETKKVQSFVISNTSPSEIKPIIYNHISDSAHIMTDEWIAYEGLSQHYNHDFVNHRAKQYANGDVTTNRIENFWSVFKRTIKGSYIQVSPK